MARNRKIQAYNDPNLNPAQTALLKRIFDAWRQDRPLESGGILGRTAFKDLPAPIATGTVWDWLGLGTEKIDTEAFGEKVFSQLHNKMLVYQVVPTDEAGKSANIRVFMPTPAGVRYMMEKSGISPFSNEGEDLFDRAVAEFVAVIGEQTKARQKLRALDNVTIEECSPEYYALLNTYLNFPNPTLYDTPDKIRVYQRLADKDLLFCNVGRTAGCYVRSDTAPHAVSALPTPRGAAAVLQIAQQKNMAVPAKTAAIRTAYLDFVDNVNPLLRTSDTVRAALSGTERRRRAKAARQIVERTATGTPLSPATETRAGDNMATKKKGGAKTTATKTSKPKASAATKASKPKASAATKASKPSASKPSASKPSTGKTKAKTKVHQGFGVYTSGGMKGRYFCVDGNRRTLVTKDQIPPRVLKVLGDVKPAARKPSASKPSASKPSASKPSASKPSASKPSASKAKTKVHQGFGVYTSGGIKGRYFCVDGNRRTLVTKDQIPPRILKVLGDVKPAARKSSASKSSASKSSKKGGGRAGKGG